MIGNRAWPITQEPKDIALSNLDFFVKLDFDIAIDQKTRARDRTFEGVQDSGSATPIFSQ